MNSLENSLQRSGHDEVSTSGSPLEILWNIGLAPLMSGLGFFLLATPDLIGRFLPQTILAQQGVRWLAICLAAATLATNAIWSRQFIKSLSGAPRKRPGESKRNNWLLLPAVLVPLFLVPLVAAYAFTSYGHHPSAYSLDHDKLAAPTFTLIFAALSLYYARKRKAPMLLAYGIYLIGLAWLIWWLPLSPTERNGLLMSGAGGPQAVFGAMRLRAFLRSCQ